MLRTPGDGIGILLQVEGADALVWHKHVPLKVSIFAWRLVKNRLPTRSNLLGRGVLLPADAGCLLGCGLVETSQHLFISCDFYGTLWFKVRSWLGVSGPYHIHVPEHFFQFSYSAGGVRARCSLMQLVWLLSVWTIWNDRNQRLFNSTGSSIDQLLDRVKRYSLWWLKANNVVFVFDSQLWWSSPLTCLGLT
ncbi:uncharacterized protein [Medicago truncatula]|uniref:uncharacterized protein n=1 Tax=Medicago truncatula TaxID=3880 RepID=UPI000D2F303D|nr:uncharacterized protein LOC112417428 [Medicago truncatula]